MVARRRMSPETKRPVVKRRVLSKDQVEKEAASLTELAARINKCQQTVEYYSALLGK